MLIICHVDVGALELDFTSHFKDFTGKTRRNPCKVKAFMIDCCSY